jgi:hypothetical protein
MPSERIRRPVIGGGLQRRLDLSRCGRTIMHNYWLALRERVSENCTKNDGRREGRRSALRDIFVIAPLCPGVKISSS